MHTGFHSHIGSYSSRVTPWQPFQLSPSRQGGADTEGHPYRTDSIRSLAKALSLRTLDLLHASGDEKRFAGYPTSIGGCKKNYRGRDILWLTDTAQRSLCLKLSAKVTIDDPASVQT